MTVVFREAAKNDLVRQYRYYLVDLNVPDVAGRFKEAVRKSAKEIREHPRVGQSVALQSAQVSGLRSWPVMGFGAWRLYYFVRGDFVEVVRILHSKQNVARMIGSAEPI